MQRHLDFPEAVWSLEFSPTGRLLIAGGLGYDFYRDIASGRNRTLPTLRVTRALTPQEDTLAVSSEEGIKVTPLFEPDKVLCFFPMPRFVHMNFSPDGSHLVYQEPTGVYNPTPADEQISCIDIKGRRVRKLSRWTGDLRQRLKPYGQTMEGVSLRGWHKDRGVLLRISVTQENPKGVGTDYVCWLDPFRDALIGRLDRVDLDYTRVSRGRYLVGFQYPAGTDQVLLAYTDLRTGAEVKVTSFPHLQGGSDEGLGISCAKDAPSAVVFGARRLSEEPSRREYQGYIWRVDLLNRRKRLLIREPQNTRGMDEDRPLVSAALSPDGKGVAYVSRRGQRRVRILDAR